MKKRMKYALIMIFFIIIASTTKAYAVAGKVNQETVRMRKEASTESSIVTLISLNEDVEIISEDGEWYKVKKVLWMMTLEKEVKTFVLKLYKGFMFADTYIYKIINERKYKYEKIIYIRKCNRRTPRQIM